MNTNQTNLISSLKEVTGEDYDLLCSPLTEEEQARLAFTLTEAYESYFQRHPEEWDEKEYNNDEEDDREE